MPDGPQPIFTDNPGQLPATYTIPAGVAFDVASVFAKFDGSAASGSFLPCLTVLTQDGHVVARVRPDETYSVGDTGDITWSSQLSGDSGSDNSSIYHKISAASTNAAVVKASAGTLTGYYIVNTAGAFRYVKLYDKASSPTVGTDTPAVVLGVPATSAANVSLDSPASFTTGIAIATVAGIADSDTSAVSANDLAITLYYE